MKPAPPVTSTRAIRRPPPRGSSRASVPGAVAQERNRTVERLADARSARTTNGTASGRACARFARRSIPWLTSIAMVAAVPAPGRDGNGRPFGICSEQAARARGASSARDHRDSGETGRRRASASRTRPPGRTARRSSRTRRGRVGDVLEHLEAEHDVEARVLDRDRSIEPCRSACSFAGHVEADDLRRAREAARSYGRSPQPTSSTRARDVLRARASRAAACAPAYCTDVRRRLAGARSFGRISLVAARPKASHVSASSGMPATKPCAVHSQTRSAVASSAVERRAPRRQPLAPRARPRFANTRDPEREPDDAEIGERLKPRVLHAVAPVRRRRRERERRLVREAPVRRRQVRLEVRGLRRSLPADAEQPDGPSRSRQPIQARSVRCA